MEPQPEGTRHSRHEGRIRSWEICSGSIVGHMSGVALAQNRRIRQGRQVRLLTGMSGYQEWGTGTREPHFRCTPTPYRKCHHHSERSYGSHFCISLTEPQEGLEPGTEGPRLCFAPCPALPFPAPFMG